MKKERKTHTNNIHKKKKKNVRKTRKQRTKTKTHTTKKNTTRTKQKNTKRLKRKEKYTKQTGLQNAKVDEYTPPAFHLHSSPCPPPLLPSHLQRTCSPRWKGFSKTRPPSRSRRSCYRTPWPAQTPQCPTHQGCRCRSGTGWRGRCSMTETRRERHRAVAPAGPWVHWG